MDFGSVDFGNIKSRIGDLGSINGGSGNDGNVGSLNGWFAGFMQGWNLGSTFYF